MEDLRNESILEGIDIGDLRTTVKYYKKGKITLEEAAEDLNMTVEEFKEKIQRKNSASGVIGRCDSGTGA